MYVLSISSVSEVLMVLISDMTFLLCVVLACRTKAAPPGALPDLGGAPGAPAATPIYAGPRVSACHAGRTHLRCLISELRICHVDSFRISMRLEKSGVGRGGFPMKTDAVQISVVFSAGRESTQK